MLFRSVWVSSTLLWRDRVGGKVMLLLGGLLPIGMPVIHLNGRGYGGDFAKADAAFRFIWTLYALGVLGVAIVMLSIRELLELRRAVHGSSASEIP